MNKGTPSHWSSKKPLEWLLTIQRIPFHKCPLQFGSNLPFQSFSPSTHTIHTSQMGLFTNLNSNSDWLLLRLFSRCCPPVMFTSSSKSPKHFLYLLFGNHNMYFFCVFINYSWAFHMYASLFHKNTFPRTKTTFYTALCPSRYVEPLGEINYCSLRKHGDFDWVISP